MDHRASPSKIVFLLLILGGTCLPLATFSFSFVPGTSYKFAYKTETSLNDVPTSIINSHSSRKDVGVRLHALVEVTSLWSLGPTRHFVKLSVTDVNVESLARGDQTLAKVDSLLKTPVFFLWEEGMVVKTFVSEEFKLSANIYQGIISLFQLSEKSHTTERDVSGTCEVDYDRRDDHKLVKTKRTCSTDGKPFHSNTNKVFGVRKHSWSRAEYSMSDNFILSVKSQESHEVNSELGSTISVVNAKQQLSLLERNPSKERTYSGSLDDVISKIKKSSKKLVESTLGVTAGRPGCRFDCAKLSDLVERLKDNISTSSIGRSSAALAFQELLPAFRLVSKQEIEEILVRYRNNMSVYLSLIDVVCATQTNDSLKALIDVLSFEKEERIVALERFLLGMALSTHPSQALISYLIEISDLNLTNEKLRESVLGALGAVIYTYKSLKTYDEQVVKQAEDVLLRHLALCKNQASCQQMVIRALSNAGLSSTAEVIMKVAESTKVAIVGEACLKAMRRFDINLINMQFRNRLKDIFLQKKRFYDTSVRSQALKLLFRLNLHEEEIKNLFLESLDPWNTDYGLYIQSRLFDESHKNKDLGTYLGKVLENSLLNNYHVLAPKGNSLAFSSDLYDSPKVEYLMYVENGRSGTMKRSGMDVDLQHLNETLPLYKFELFAAGLGSLLGEEADGEEVTAGMSLDMMGVSLRPITFFVGKGSVMSAIWNAPSDLVSALQINFLLQDHQECISLGNGFSVQVETTGVVSLDLSGSLSVSLWNKNAHSLIRNNGSVVLRSSIHIETGLFRSRVEQVDELESGIDFLTDVDFYDGVKMCLQMLRPHSFLKRQTTRHEWIRHVPRSFLSRTKKITKFPGISYPLPKSNYEKCRTLFPSDS